MDPVIVKSSTPFILSVFLSLFQHESNDDGMFGPHLGGLDSVKTWIWHLQMRFKKKKKKKGERVNMDKTSDKTRKF